jgi:hypothetical protein
MMRLRGELIERTFAHAFETGGMRRTHLRHHDNTGMDMGDENRGISGRDPVSIRRDAPDDVPIR